MQLQEWVAYHVRNNGFQCDADRGCCVPLVVCQQADNKKTVEATTEFVSGVLFALGLVYTAMVRPSKVGFKRMSGLLNGSCWDDHPMIS
jgi:hypothetical protein